MQTELNAVQAPRRASHGQPKKVASFTFSAETLKRLKAFAKKRGISMSEFVEGTVSALMDQDDQQIQVEGAAGPESGE